MWKRWNQSNHLWELSNDNGNTWAPLPVTALGYYERARPVQLGHWQDVPFNAGNFAADSGGTWTVGAPAVIRNRYTIIGLTMIWSFYISWFSGSNVVSGTVTALRMKTPGGYIAAPNAIQAIDFAIDNGRTDIDSSFGGLDYMLLNKRDGAAFTNGGAIGIIGTLTFEIQGANLERATDND